MLRWNISPDFKHFNDLNARSRFIRKMSTWIQYNNRIASGRIRKIICGEFII